MLHPVPDVSFNGGALYDGEFKFNGGIRENCGRLDLEDIVESTVQPLVAQGTL